MASRNGNIKDIHSLFEEIKNKNPQFTNIRKIYDIYEKIKIFYANNMKSIDEQSLKKKNKRFKN
jgi:hypothetical protein